MSGTTDDEARLWAVRLEAGGMSGDDEAALDQWLAGDDRRQGALLRAQAILSYFERGRALAGGRPAADAPAPVAVVGQETAKDGRLSRRQLLAASLVGGLTMAGGTGLWLSERRPRIETAVGEVRRVALADGSVATVNTASRLVVDMGKESRKIRLDEGEAWFKVAHDPARPFLVEAGEVRVRAVGTAFSVLRDGEGADVLVTEGIVETWLVGREAESRRIDAGTAARVSLASAEIETEAAAPRIERALAWRQGEIAFDGQTLGEAVAQFNRYNQTKLLVSDPKLGREPVVGYFSATDPIAFARAFSPLVGAEVKVAGDTIRIEKNVK
ncbi:FecR family protein [Sphingosinicella rhizophila]|uniref:FecR domain-containing protein n=1 Tax=Sphingosinicella rhizophila TaxID=3050082 RepID=A0ABU3Q9N7_9SPHN|nr:FecR domain-containing protein [Sphingosinicella sp. GR2756]MDT9600116.1 FecR domain-containing protein [Sphingosinicella sp. GR2756]